MDNYNEIKECTGAPPVTGDQSINLKTPLLQFVDLYSPSETHGRIQVATHDGTEIQLEFTNKNMEHL